MILLIIANILIETLVAFFLGYRSFKQILAVVFVNLFTHPLFLYFLSISHLSSQYQVLLFLEMIVVIVEWILLMLALREDKKQLFYLSITMNFFSLWVGIFLLPLANNIISPTLY
jgi:hypothetical protein